MINAGMNDLADESTADEADLDGTLTALAEPARRQVVELLRAAVTEGQASPGNLAYLVDRVAAGLGEPQEYGTQIRCGPDGPDPAVPIEDEEHVDERRADAGLGPLADYLAELAEVCAEVG